jgi:site-specific DNA-methyltransferase (adenine-specific)
MELMAQYPDKYFDLAVVDPPYGIGIIKTELGNYGIRPKNFTGSMDKSCGWDFERPSKEYFIELDRIAKNYIVWGGNYFMDLIQKASSCWLVWDKKNGASYWADSELAFTTFKTATRLFSNTSVKNNRIHPTQKPVALYDWIFKNYAQEGQKILDTHLGSGSSRIAAWKAKLNFVGCELDTDYFGAQEKRFAEFRKQLTMF